MKEFGSDGEVINYNRKAISKIADKHDLVFIEEENFIILSGRKEGTNPWSNRAKIVIHYFNSWSDAVQQAREYDLFYTKINLTHANK